MIGGLIKSNRLAVLAGSAFIAGGLAVSPAQAADLGGDCCADLEERVAVLEATTARKGNRKVSLTISGMMFHQLMIWDDGVDSDAYHGTNVQDAGTALMFSGNAKVNSDLSAGYYIRINLNMGDNYSQDQLNDDGLFDDLFITNSNIWIKSESMGKVTLGREHPAADNIGFVDFSGLGSAITANLVMFDGAFMFLRDANTAGKPFVGSLGTGNARWGHISNCNHNGPGVHVDCDGYPRDIVRYDSPTIAGFVLSASWGEDDSWDLAVRYNNQFGDFKVYVGAAYSDLDDDEAGPVTSIEYTQVAGAIMHVPTGLFVNGIWGTEEVDLNPAVAGTATKPDADMWYLKVGIKQKWNALGATVLYGEWGGSDDAFDATDGLFIAGEDVVASEYRHYGLGIVQEIDAASMAVWAKWKHYEGDVDTNGATHIEFEDLDVFAVGGVLTF